MSELFPKKLLLSIIDNPDLFNLYLPNVHDFVDKLLQDKSNKICEICGEISDMFDILGLKININIDKLKLFLDKILLSEELTLIYMDFLFMRYDNDEFIELLCQYKDKITEIQKRCIKYHIEVYIDYAGSYSVNLYKIYNEFRDVTYTEDDVKEFKSFEYKDTDTINLITLEEIKDTNCYINYIKWMVEFFYSTQYGSLGLPRKNKDSMKFWHSSDTSDINKKLTNEMIPYFRDNICSPIRCRRNCFICFKSTIFDSDGKFIYDHPIFKK